MHTIAENAKPVVIAGHSQSCNSRVILSVSVKIHSIYSVQKTCCNAPHLCIF